MAKEFLAGAIIRARDKHDFDLWAYIFMPEHVHMIIFPKREEYSTSEILKFIKQSVSRRIVARLKEKNPRALRQLETGLKQPRYRFWQDGRGYDRNYWSASEIIRQVEYIHHNPVRRGLVEKPEDWYWSSARDWMTGEEGPIRINKESFPVL